MKVAGENEIHHTLGRIEEGITFLKEETGEIKKDMKQGFIEINKRTRKLENWRSTMVGAWGTLYASIIAWLRWGN